MNPKRLLVMLAVVVALAGCAMPITEEGRLVDSGFDHILHQRWTDAEVDLLEALELDPDNPYALLNLGVVYQQTGRAAEARELYNRLIESGSTAVAARSNMTREIGRPVTALAEDNLYRMGASAGAAAF